VGFIRDLPPQLVAAFRATLEELREADVFLHVVDASGDVDRRIAAVRRVLGEMGLGGVPELLVFNKIDRLPPGDGARLAREYGAVPISAQAAIGLGALLERVDELLFESGRPLQLPAGDAVHAFGRG
jgi:GTP-binding protein HflX